MIECLSKLVGIKGACSDIAGFDQYVNSLTGISIEAAEAAINSEKESGFALLQEKIDLAQDAMASEMRSFLSNKMRQDSLIDSDVIGRFSDDMSIVPAEAYLKGIQLRMIGYLNAEVVITSVRLMCQHTGSVTVHIYDLIQNKEVYSFDLDAVAGELVEKTINFRHTIFSKWLNLAIVYDATSIGGYSTAVYNGTANCATCGPFASFFQCGWGNGHYAYARAIKLDSAKAKTNQNVIGTPYTAGLGITYSLTCSPEQLLCQLAPSLAYPLLWKAGMFIMEEMRFSKRLNSVITLHKSEHKELWTLYESRYEAAMNEIFQNIRLPNDTCFRCNPRTKSVSALP